MDKERATAFTDAILAIIMTILVLELKEPASHTWAGLWALWVNYFAYALSFFWLGTMWIGLHNEWQQVKKISYGTLWWMLLLLFWASLFPYTTKIVASDFDNTMTQVLYGVIIALTTVTNLCLSRSLVKNPANKAMTEKSRFRQRWLLVDLGIKALGLVIAFTVYPPAAAYSAFLAALVIAVPSHVLESRHHYSLKDK